MISGRKVRMTAIITNTPIPDRSRFTLPSMLLYASETDPPTMGIKELSAKRTVFEATESAALAAIPCIDRIAVNRVIARVSVHFNTLAVISQIPLSLMRSLTADDTDKARNIFISGAKNTDDNCEIP